MDENKTISLKYLFFTFLKIGAISWGGFMALIAVVQKQLVDKDKVIREEVILDGISLASVLPGAVAINVVTYVGYQLRGIKGALVSMVATVFPGISDDCRSGRPLHNLRRTAHSQQFFFWAFSLLLLR